MGMTLAESVDNLEKVESNGVTAFIDSNTLKYLDQYGNITIDHISRDGAVGYMITVGNPDCSGGCAGCG